MEQRKNPNTHRHRIGAVGRGTSTWFERMIKEALRDRRSIVVVCIGPNRTTSENENDTEVES